MGPSSAPNISLLPKQPLWTKLPYFFRALYIHLTGRLLKPKYKATKRPITPKIPVSYHVQTLTGFTNTHRTTTLSTNNLLRTFSKPCRRVKVQLNVKKMKKQNKTRQRAEHRVLECKKMDCSAVCSPIRLRSNLQQVQLLPSACFLG